MEFREMLNDYMTLFNCTAKTLATASDLSPTVISRYRSGERIPMPGSIQFEKLCHGIAALSAESGRGDLTQESVQTAFLEVLASRKTNPRILADNLNMLISVLEINKAELSRFLNYDPSYLSRICSGQRTPSNTDKFILDVCRFVVRRFSRESDKKAIADLMGCSSDLLVDDYSYQNLLLGWFGTQNILPESTDMVSTHLLQLDNLDLEEYLEKNAFSGEETDTDPHSPSFPRVYYGLEQMKVGELDFFEATLRSGSDKTLFMCSDIPVNAFRNDQAFHNRYIRSLTTLVSKGIKLAIIHNMSLPANELRHGTEVWLPIYTTGLVRSCYLKEPSNAIYSHLDYVSGGAALSGECVTGFHEDGKYYLTTDPQEIRYYRKRSEYLLRKAEPLMDIYASDQFDDFQQFLETDARLTGNRREIATHLPVYVLDDELLSSILTRLGIKGARRDAIQEYVARIRILTGTVLTHGHYHSEIPFLSEDEFREYPASLSLTDLLLGGGICLAAMLLRLSFIDRYAGDYEYYLESWLKRFAGQSFSASMRMQVVKAF